LRRDRALLLAGVAAGATAVYVTLRRRTVRSAPAPRVLLGGPLLIAHRGGSLLAPENTMAAFRGAVDAWNADMIELDVHATADGRCVVIHDSTIDRTTDGTGAVASMTFDELRAFDAGYRFTNDGGHTFPFRGCGVTVPSIDEVLEALPRTRLTIEVKAGAAQMALFESIERHGAADRIVAAGMYDADRTEFGSWRGAVSPSSEQMTRWYKLHLAALGTVTGMTGDVVQLPEHHEGRRILTPRLIRDLHHQGVHVHVWTVNDPADMNRLLDWGVDGIVSDRPDLLGRILEQRYERAR
jgi:glycerophosphoryl diester phosphodiesterase